ncbi:hypothetical protein WN944_027091 [Citrus x changshan-huyou]|uniref:Uncharacterized protein n=1 Tax=Citrus x changshan-huyou TaxID=2935761 RepID=A0AAP0Q865_9ROSI
MGKLCGSSGFDSPLIFHGSSQKHQLTNAKKHYGVRKRVGLKSAEVERRRKIDGLNELEKRWAINLEFNRGTIQRHTRSESGTRLIGMETEIGKVHRQIYVASQSEEDAPLKKKLNDFGEVLTKMIGVICVLYDVIEVGVAWGLVEGMDGDDMEPSPSVEITVVVCGVTSSSKGFESCVQFGFWDARGCGMVSDGSRVMLAAVGWRRRLPKGRPGCGGCDETKAYLD